MPRYAYRPDLQGRGKEGTESRTDTDKLRLHIHTLFELTRPPHRDAEASFLFFLPLPPFAGRKGSVGAFISLESINKAKAEPDATNASQFVAAAPSTHGRETGKQARKSKLNCSTPPPPSVGLSLSRFFFFFLFIPVLINYGRAERATKSSPVPWPLGGGKGVKKLFVSYTLLWINLIVHLSSSSFFILAFHSCCPKLNPKNLLFEHDMTRRHTPSPMDARGTSKPSSPSSFFFPFLFPLWFDSAMPSTRTVRAAAAARSAYPVCQDAS
ncbi:hypothetical protein IF1G_11438 [Cordyceps javanica]|uniref:Uncharacterized protein n=1 Tax=Cordyceps javanica TaxID=43265 RepID=A0A545UKB2_9HYPO|nr:hypothetical protein IF1G_11438 [Cordyceps javanica]